MGPPPRSWRHISELPVLTPPFVARSTGTVLSVRARRDVAVRLTALLERSRVGAERQRGRQRPTLSRCSSAATPRIPPTRAGRPCHVAWASRPCPGKPKRKEILVLCRDGLSESRRKVAPTVRLQCLGACPGIFTLRVQISCQVIICALATPEAPIILGPRGLHQTPLKRDSL